MDQPPSTSISRQKSATVIFNSECLKVVDRFRFWGPLYLTCGFDNLNLRANSVKLFLRES